MPVRNSMTKFKQLPHLTKTLTLLPFDFIEYAHRELGKFWKDTVIN
jgi:hypothetical protein